MSSVRFNFLDKLALLLAIIGAINWGLLAILGKDLIMGIIGLSAGAADIIYIIVGAAGVWSLIFILPRTGK